MFRKHAPPPRLRQFIIVLAIGLAATLMLLALLSEFHEEITDPWLRSADDVITNYLHWHTTPFLTNVMLALTIAGSWEAMFPVVGVAFIWLLGRGRRRDGLVLLVAVSGSSLISTLLKLLFQRPRPSPIWALAHETSFSFPSGHAIAAVTFYGTIALLLLRRTRNRAGRVAIVLVALLLILATGASRVYLGVHYPSDVVAGFLVGLVWLATVVLAARQLSPQRKFQPDDLQNAERKVLEK